MWHSVYRTAWPNFINAVPIRDLGLQKSGYDRLVILDDRLLKVEEKEDTATDLSGRQYNNLLLETISVLEKSTLGFMERDLMCDWIAFAFSHERRAVLIPWLQLREVWQRQRINWLRRRGWSVKHNRSDDGSGYTSVAVPVPIEIIQREIRETIVVNYPDPSVA